MKKYVVIWIEVDDDDDDAERVEANAVSMLVDITRGRLVQNRIQDAQP
jgi:hypothetical protein